ncbi:GNAT family N-acetyltransferase [Ahrensia sp. R2A130]|uniref:GNAT family N-acetyltransferase n=1 Tax=Ahrensia sp. R2A130 TaxID=744979 RepID=UPI0001E083F4|nr:GNAT family N-acetyltransferase [Ahrensia sp. R2A130]EFL89243.1 acetyltransferase [Ahrensia sp. R2A130]
MITLRPATETDLPNVSEWARAAYAPYVARIGREPAPMVANFAAHLADGDLHVIEADGDAVGYSVHHMTDATLFMENIAVDPQRQGGGIGRFVFDHLADLARAKGAARIDLYTNAKMTEALAFYDRLGFRITDQRIEDGFDRVYLSKDV